MHGTLVYALDAATVMMVDARGKDEFGRGRARSARRGTP